jgi:hypothetical protein
LWFPVFGYIGGLKRGSGYRYHRMRCNMDIRTEIDTEIPSERRQVYEPPILDEIGEFTALTGLSNKGSYADASGYYDL